jgi:hypothetical protein
MELKTTVISGRRSNYLAKDVPFSSIHPSKWPSEEKEIKYFHQMYSSHNVTETLANKGASRNPGANIINSLRQYISPKHMHNFVVQSWPLQQ